VNTAKLVQGLTQSELRVGMQTRDFGSVDIRTSLAHHEFSAQISVERSDVARTLSTELPGLYDRLADQKVPVGNILIQSSGLSTSSGLAQESQHSAPKTQTNVAARESSEAPLPVIQEPLSLTGRLDIRI
jgi:flagellar hook-length control protein FliK